MTSPLRIVFAGTPEFAAEHLAALINSQHHIVAVYTQPDRPSGRGKKPQPSAVKTLACEHHIPVFQPESLKPSEQTEQLARLSADVMVVVAYGLLLPRTVLQTPRYGCINVHGSLLPRWRGAAPIQRAIWAGDSETGITIMQMDEGLDTGAMLYKHAIPIEAADTSASLYRKLATIGPSALCHTLDNLLSLTAQKQDDSLATYAKKLSKEEACIDWHLGADQLCRNVQAFNPWPVAWFFHKNNAIKLWSAEVVDSDSIGITPGTILSATKDGIVVSTGKGALRMLTLQLPGKRISDVSAILNGHADWFVKGEVLSSGLIDE